MTATTYTILHQHGNTGWDHVADHDTPEAAGFDVAQRLGARGNDLLTLGREIAEKVQVERQATPSFNYTVVARDA